jgi:hypothetical protein
MATDKSEPRVGLIFRIGILAAVLLVCTRAALASYFDEISQAEEHRKIVEAKPEALFNLRSDEQKRLTEGPIPISQAMHDLATKGRASDIEPVQSKDLSPLQGWSRLPATVPQPMINSAASSAAPSGASSPSEGSPAVRPSPSAAPAAVKSTRTPGGSPSTPSAPAAPTKKKP